MESKARSHHRLVEQARRSPRFHRAPTVLTGAAPFATLDARASLATVCLRSVSRAPPIPSLELDPSFSLRSSASLEQHSVRAMPVDLLPSFPISIWIPPLLAFVERSVSARISPQRRGYKRKKGGGGRFLTANFSKEKRKNVQRTYLQYV